MEPRTSRALAVMRSSKKALVTEKGMLCSSACWDWELIGSSSSRHANATDAPPMPATAVGVQAVLVTRTLHNHQHVLLSIARSSQAVHIIANGDVMLHQSQ